ncbi:MAG: NADH-quinone oxidoreductase subunit J [Planctomycetes bacterium]|nr:NADH-quinone oxidoreductase subunit J [Planctomycetota bacterium]
MNISYTPLLFVLFGLVAVLPGIAILFTRDIVRAAFWLLASFSGFAGLYLLLHADFLSFTQVIVYIGGILILLLFGVMLTHRDPALAKRPRLIGLLGSGIAVGLLVLGALLHVVFNTTWTTNEQSFTTTTSDIGILLLTQYLLPFEISSILLLVALVGAAYIARRKEKEDVIPASAATPARPGTPAPIAAPRMAREKEGARA